jgi:ribosomal protein S20
VSDVPFLCTWLALDCAEDVEGPVVDKEKRNHCEFFMLAEKYIDKGKSRGIISGSDAKRKLDALFGE